MVYSNKYIHIKTQVYRRRGLDVAVSFAKRLQCPVPGLAWLPAAAACHGTIQARCLRPAARHHSLRRSRLSIS